jgi:hypothetical protein
VGVRAGRGRRRRHRQLEAIAAALRDFQAHEKTEREMPVYLPSDYCCY